MRIRRGDVVDFHTVVDGHTVTVAAIITKVWGDNGCSNLYVLGDGDKVAVPFSYTSAAWGSSTDRTPGTWSWRPEH